MCARAFFDNLLQENDQLNGVMTRSGNLCAEIAGLLAHVGAGWHRKKPCFQAPFAKENDHLGCGDLSDNDPTRLPFG